MRKYKLFVILAVLTAVLSGSTGCQPSQQATPPATMMQLGEQQPPANLGPDTVVPEGMKLEDYLDKYYLAYKEQRWEEAYAMLPAIRKANEDLEKYTATLTEMPLLDYKVNPARIEEDKAVVPVDVELGGTGAGMKFVINWSFVKKDGKWVAEDTKTMTQ